MESDDKKSLKRSHETKTEKSSKKSKKVESDDEDAGSLKDFIVEEEDSPHSDAESEVDVVAIKPEDTDTLSLLTEEATRFTSGVTGTEIAGRVLRSRKPEDIEKRKTKDMYYERFGRDEEARLMEKFTKKDILEFIKKLEKDHRADYETAGHVWPDVNSKMSLDKIREEYEPLKKFLELPDSDEETDEESDDSEDETEEDEESEDSDESEEEETDEDEEEEHEEESEDDASSDEEED